MNQPLCQKDNCNRIAEVEVDGVWLCWEAYLPDDPIRWKVKYPHDQEPRHFNPKPTGVSSVNK
jgi:hypothetical protein